MCSSWLKLYQIKETWIACRKTTTIKEVFWMHFFEIIKQTTLIKGRIFLKKIFLWKKFKNKKNTVFSITDSLMPLIFFLHNCKSQWVRTSLSWWLNDQKIELWFVVFDVLGSMVLMILNLLCYFFVLTEAIIVLSVRMLDFSPEHDNYKQSTQSCSKVWRLV